MEGNPRNMDSSIFARCLEDLLSKVSGTFEEAGKDDKMVKLQLTMVKTAFAANAKPLQEIFKAMHDQDGKNQRESNKVTPDGWLKFFQRPGPAKRVAQLSTPQ